MTKLNRMPGERRSGPGSFSPVVLMLLTSVLTVPLRGAAPEVTDYSLFDDLDEVVVNGIKPRAVEDFVARQRVDSVVLSPNGTRLAVGHMAKATDPDVRLRGGNRVTMPMLDGFTMQLSVLELPSLRTTISHQFPVAFFRFTDFLWTNENRLLDQWKWPSPGFRADWKDTGRLTISDIERKTPIVMSIDPMGMIRKSAPVELRELTGTIVTIAAGPLDVVDARTGVADQALIQTTLSEKKGNPLKYGAFEMRTDNGALKRVASLPVEGGKFLTGENHRVTLTTATNSRHERTVHYLPPQLRTKEREEPDVRHWQLRVTSDAINGLEPLAWTGKAEEYYALDGRDLPTRAVVIWDAEQNTRRVLHSDPQVDMQTFSVDPTGKPWMFSGNGKYPAYWYLDMEHPLVHLHQTLVQKLPREQIEILNATDDYALALAKISSARRPPVFALLDVKSARTLRTFETYPQLSGSRMAHVDAIEFEASDGVTIQGYLTTPLDAEGNRRHKAPMVVIAHEGPQGKAADYGFDFERQLFATYGYAVLQVNHRGLIGRGAQFADPSKWRSDAQEDIQAGVHWAIQQGAADASRICFYGSGHGAGSALTAAAHAQELFHCVVGVNGTYDTTLVNNAASIKANVLLMHQRHDPQFPIEAASRLRGALRAAGRAPEWEIIAPDDMGFITPDARADAYRKIIHFLDQQLSH